MAEGATSGALTRNEMAPLPRRVRFALAARAVERVMPATVSTHSYWKVEAQDYLMAIDTVIRCAELLAISIEDVRHREGRLLRFLSTNYFKILDAAGQPQRFWLFERTLLTHVLRVLGYLPVVAIMDAARGGFARMARGHCDDETSGEYNAAVGVASAANALCGLNVDWIVGLAARAAAEISAVYGAAETFDAAWETAHHLYWEAFNVNLARATAARADPGYESACAVVAAARNKQHARRTAMEATVVAAAGADRDWLLKNCPAHADAIVPREYFSRPLWPAGLPHDWQKILDDWRENLRLIGLEDIFLRHKAVRRGTPVNWDDVCQRVWYWSRTFSRGQTPVDG